MSFGYQALGLLAALLVVACVTDAARRRIPNAVSAAVAVVGLLAQASGSGFRAAGLAAGAALAVLALLAAPWRFGILGGGDVKLAAACAAWTSFQRLPLFLLATALAGGVLAAGVAVRHAHLAFAPGAARPGLEIDKVRIPYAFAIGGGALVALLWRFP